MSIAQCVAVLSTENSLPIAQAARYLPGMNVDEIADVIRRTLKKKGWSPFRAASRARLPENAIRTVLDGHEPRVGRLAEICDVLDLELYVGPPRWIDAVDAQHFRDLPVSMRRHLLSATHNLVRLTIEAGGDPIPPDLKPYLAQRHHVHRFAHDTDDMPSQGSPVPVTKLSVIAGGGRETKQEAATGHVWFDRDWLHRHRLDPGRCVMIKVKGNSMEPTLPEGCSILVNRAQTTWCHEAIYIVRTSDGLLAGRARETDGGDRMFTSDQHSWDDLPWPDDAKIMGQVVWVARGLTDTTAKGKPSAKS